MIADSEHPLDGHRGTVVQVARNGTVVKLDSGETRRVAWWRLSRVDKESERPSLSLVNRHDATTT